MPAVYALELYRGDTYSWQFVLWDDQAKTIPHDLTNVVPKAEIRDRPSGKTIVPLALSVSLPNVIDAALDAASSALVPFPAVWDLQLTYATGAVSTVLAGPVSITLDVTDSTPTAAPAMRRIA